MRTLIALDHSDCSQAAIESVLAHSNDNGGALRLLHVLAPFNPIEPGQTVSPTRWATWAQSVREHRRAEALSLLANAVALLRARFTKSEITTELCEGSMVADIIIEAAGNWHADLIVVGSHGRTGINRFLLGSVSNAVLVGAACSVEIARPNTAGDTRHNVLVAVDKSDHSKLTLDVVSNQSWNKDTAFELVTIVQPFFELYGYELSVNAGFNLVEEENKAVRATESFLAEQAEFLKERVPSLITRSALTGDVRESILKLADEWPANLVVVGSHDRQGLSRILLGSVSQSIVLRAACSVRVIKSVIQ